MNIIPNCDVFPSISTSFSSDETKYEEANNEEHKRSSSTLCNFNHAPDSNGGSAGIIEQIYRSTISLVETVTSKKFNRQYEHSWNYASHPTIIIRHPSKEWTIAILLKLLLIAWDMWTYRIGFKFKTSQRCGKVKNRRRKKYVRVFTLPRRNTVQHHGKSSFADHTNRNENNILSACHVFA